MKKVKKKITLESLATSIENLAQMTARGFEHIHDTMVTKGELKDELKNLATKADLTKIERTQEDMKLRLDNVAYRFELQDLQQRVTRLEHKTGITK